MADALIKYETIDEEQIKDIMAGKPPQAAARAGTTRCPTSRRKAPAERQQPAAPIGSPAGQH